ncbi:hypothetical protein KAX02_00005 [candidate division WOR-3 bacterium]|nr:hypothetical protein [candidate division WOR-3 bacterium]
MIPVTVLTYRRPAYLERVLKSFFEVNREILECLSMIVLVQGSKGEETDHIINKHKEHFYHVIYSGSNIGVAAGYSRVMMEALELKPSYIIHLEDDFLSNESLSPYLSELVELLKKADNVGCIRLRSVKNKVLSYNMVSGKGTKYRRVTRNIVVGNAHFTFNPTITKSEVIEKIISVTSEERAMEKYHQLGLETGQLLAECFTHIGNVRCKNWRK